MADFFKNLFGKKEPEPEPLPPAPKPRPIPHPPDTGTHDTSTPDFVEIGGSPVPGLTLRHVLRGHEGWIGRIAWSPDGKYLASPSNDTTIRIWDVSTGECIHVLEGHTTLVNSIAWLPKTQNLVSVDYTGSMIVWDVVNETNIITKSENTSNLNGHVIFSPSGMYLALTQGNDIHIWDVSTWTRKNILRKHTFEATSLVWLTNGERLLSGGRDDLINVWDSSNWYTALKGHSNSVYFLCTNATQSLIASCGADNAIIVWDATNFNKQQLLEGHTSTVICISFSSDGKLLISKSHDNEVRIWRTDNWQTLVNLQELSSGFYTNGIAFHPHLPILATLGEKDTIIRIWELDEAVLLGQAKENVNYTTAKLVLVGDSGVGKTGLGWRLAHGEFKEHASTHGQQFWSIPQLNLKRQDGTDCEAVLWDLAGQHVYRQVHSIFLENVAAALVLFDPTNRQEPLKGAQFWLEQLKGKGQLPPTVLVGARVDRGAPALSQDELKQFCQRYGIKGGYISTSALNGDGLDELLEIVKAQIPWDDMTATVTTVTFKRIKDYVLSLKEKTDRKGVLVSPAELRKLLEEEKRTTDGRPQTASEGQATEKGGAQTAKAAVGGQSAAVEPWTFTDAEMMTAVGHLDTHGYVSILHNSAGEQTILLTPDLLVNLAASIMLLADKNPRELGAVSETELLQGKYPFDELKGLEPREAQTLLDAAILRFLEHNICFRDTFNDDTLLIFPSLIKQKRPLQDEAPGADDISYVVRGRVENLYASLVVLLGYTPSFSRINQWQNQAQYEMDAGQVCGFRSIEEREGELELVLYYGDQMPRKGRELYQELFEQFLYQREVDVTRFPPAVCPKGHPIERNTFISRLRENQKFVFCYACDEKVSLPELKQEQTIGLGASLWLQREEAMARLRSSYEVHLSRIKSYRRGWATPRAYLSHLTEQKDWAKKLIHDLQDAGVYIIEKSEDLKAEDFVIVLNTSAYEKAYKAALPVLANDAKAIQTRLGSKKLLALGCDGKPGAHHIEQCPTGGFNDDSHYSVSLFNLILNLYAIPFTHAGFAPLRLSLHEQWEQIPVIKEEKHMTALKIFISYAHKDETFKDELITMLSGLQRRGVVDAWVDRRTDAGDDWESDIQNAMDDCDLALLLVSPDYLASRYIQEKEQPTLLKRRAEMKTRIIPILIRPCMWLSEPALSGIQGLPRDNKAVITFSKDNGDRDKAWLEIAAEIEKRARAKSTP
jgi:small GTP-binding protein